MRPHVFLLFVLQNGGHETDFAHGGRPALEKYWHFGQQGETVGNQRAGKPPDFVVGGHVFFFWFVVFSLKTSKD